MKKENKTGAVRGNHCYALHNATINHKETEQLLVVLSYAFGVMKSSIQDGSYSKKVLKADAPLAWIDGALKYCKMRLGADVVHQHLDCGGVRVVRAW